MSIFVEFSGVCAGRALSLPTSQGGVNEKIFNAFKQIIFDAFKAAKLAKELTLIHAYLCIHMFSMQFFFMCVSVCVCACLGLCAAVRVIIIYRC